MRLSRLDYVIALGLALVALIVRLPFRSRYLYHWDSINFALSLEKYNVSLHQPHPPGYILYSLLGKVAFLIFRDANQSLVWISVISGVLGVVAIFGLGKILFNQDVGVLGALLTLTSPLHWFYSEIALTYSLEFFLVTVCALICYLLIRGKHQLWWIAAILLGIAGGVRQNDLLFLFPLWMLSLRGLPNRQKALSFSILSLVIGLWAVPMIWLSGGIQSYWAVLTSQGSDIAQESFLFSFAQVGLNGLRIGLYLFYALLLGTISLAYLFLSRYRNIFNWRDWIRNQMFWFFAMWIAPSLSFYLLIHVRQHGHIFTFLPAVLLLSAFGLLKLGNDLGRVLNLSNWTWKLGIIFAIANIGFYLAAPPSILGSNRLPLQVPGWQTIRHRDLYLSERFQKIRTFFDPSNTVVLAEGLDFRHPDYYLRDYQLTTLSYSLRGELFPLPKHISNLVLFNDSLIGRVSSSLDLKRLRLSDGETLYYLSWGANQKILISQDRIEIATKNSQ